MVYLNGLLGSSFCLVLGRNLQLISHKADVSFPHSILWRSIQASSIIIILGRKFALMVLPLPGCFNLLLLHCIPGSLEMCALPFTCPQAKAQTALPPSSPHQLVFDITWVRRPSCTPTTWLLGSQHQAPRTLAQQAFFDSSPSSSLSSWNKSKVPIEASCRWSLVCCSTNRVNQILGITAQCQVTGLGMHPQNLHSLTFPQELNRLYFSVI